MRFHLLDQNENGNTYEVFTAEDAFLGTIRSYHPTRERRTRGRRYVNARWRGRTLEWLVHPAGEREQRQSYPTRKQAAAALSEEER